MAISFSGLASGLDTASWVTSLTALKQAKVTTLQTQAEKVVSARDTLANIKSFFSTFRSKIEKITDSKFNIATMDIFSKKVAQTSAAAKVTATAKADAAEGTYEVKVNQLATNTQVQSGYRYKTQVVTTTQAVDMSYLKHMGITAGEVKVQHAGVLSSINIEENDKMTDLLQKFRDKGIEASFNNSTGVFSFDVGIEGIWDTGMTGFVDKLKLVGVNYGYQNENQLNIEDVETIYRVADYGTKLTDLGINVGTENSKITIEANGQEYTFALEENDTMGSLRQAMYDEHIQVDLTDGIFTIRDAVITDDGDTGFIAALGLSEEVSNVAQSTDGLQYHTVYLETSVATGDSYIKDLNGVNFEAGQTVVVKNRYGNSTTISLNEGAKIDDLLNGMRTAGLTVDFTDGVLTVDNGWITGGTFDIEGTFGLEYTTTPAIVTGSSLNQTITTHETATLGSKLVGDLGATTGNVKITDAGGTAHLFNVTNDSTLQDFINAVDSYGLSATYDGVTGVVTLHGGAYESITGGSNLYNVMFGSDTPAASSYNSASSVSQELKVRTTQTVQMTGATALSALGITNQTVTFNESTTIAINNSWTMDQLVTHLRDDIGLDASFDSATGKLTVENATIKGSTGNFAEKMGFEETITGRYVTSNTLVGQTVTIGVDLTSNGAVLVETGTVTGTSTAGQSTTGGSINIVTTTTVGQTQTGTQITYNSVSESTSTTETVITTPGEATISTVGQSQTGNVSGYDYSVTTTALTQTGATMSYISVGSTKTVITIPGTTTVSTTGLAQTGGVVTYVTYSIQQGQTTQTSTTEMTYGSLTTVHATNSLEGGALSQSIVTTTTQGQTFVTGVLSYESQDYKSSNILIHLTSAPNNSYSTISTAGLGYKSSGYSTISVSGNWQDMSGVSELLNPGNAYNDDNWHIQRNNNWVDLSSHWEDTLTINVPHTSGNYTTTTIKANHSYEINDAGDLQYLIDLAKTTDLTGYQFKLNADINAANINYGVKITDGIYRPVAAIVNMKGTIDGNGHKITGCDRALFDSFQGTIQNVQFENATISASVTGSQGVLAKTISGSTTVNNVKFTSCSVTTTDWESAAGMVAGTVVSGATVTIDNAEISSSNIQVQGYYAGGLIGMAGVSSGNTTVNVTDTKVSNTTIKSSGATGALLGVAKYVNINHCSITQIKSEGGTVAGGVIGSATGGTITSVATLYTSVHAGSNLDGTVVDYSDWIKAGGFAGGWGTGRIEHCYMNNTTVTNACTASTAQTAGFCNFSSTSNNFYFEDCISCNLKVSSANGMTAGFATATNNNNAHFTSCKITGTSTSIGSSATDINLTVAGFLARGSYTASATVTFDSCFVRANKITGCSTAGFMDIATSNNTIRNCATYVTNNNASRVLGGASSNGFVRKALGGSFTSIKVQGTTTGEGAYGFCQTMNSSATVNDVEILGTVNGTGDNFSAGYACGFGGNVSGNISTVKIGANITASGDVSLGEFQSSASAYGFGNVVSGNISSVNITGTMSGTVVKGFSGTANNSNTTIKCCWTATTTNVNTTSAQAFLARSSNTATASTTDMLYYGSRRIAIGNNAKVRDVMGLPDDYQVALDQKITLTDGTYYELGEYSTVAEIKSYLNSKGIDLVGTLEGGNSIHSTGTAKVMSIADGIKSALCITENTASSAQFTDIASATTKLSVLGVNYGTYTITKTAAGADPNTVPPTTFKVTVNANTTVGSLVQAFTNQGITSSIGNDGKITVGSGGTSVLMGAASGLSGILCNASNTISANTTNNSGVTYNITEPVTYQNATMNTEIGQLTKYNSGSALITSDQTFVVTNADNSKETITVHTTDTVGNLVTMLNQNGVICNPAAFLQTHKLTIQDRDGTDGSYISYMSSDLTKLFTTNNTTASTSMTAGYCTYAVQTTVTTAQTLGDAGLANGQYTIATTNGTITVNQNTTFATLIDEFSNKLEAADLNNGHVIVRESLSKKITGFSNDTIRDFLGLVITDAENFDLNLTSSINTATTSTTMNTLGVVGNTYVTIYNGTTNVVKTIAETDTIADVVTKLNDVLGSGGVKFNTSGSNKGKISITNKGSKYITGMSQSLQTALNITVGMNNTYKEQIRTTAATKTTLVSQTTDTVLANQNTTLGQLGFFEGDPITVAKGVSSKSLQYQTGANYYNEFIYDTYELYSSSGDITQNTRLFDLIHTGAGTSLGNMAANEGVNSFEVNYSTGDSYTINSNTTIGGLINNLAAHGIELGFGDGDTGISSGKYGMTGSLHSILNFFVQPNRADADYITDISGDLDGFFFSALLGGYDYSDGDLVTTVPVYSTAAGNMKLSETKGWVGGFTLTTGAGETIAVDSNTTINGLVSSLQAANINASYSNGQITIANGDYENYNGYIASTSSSSNMNSLLGNIITSKTIYPDVGETGYINLMDGTTIEVTNKTSLKTIVQNLNANGINTTTAAYIDDNHRINLTEGSTNAISSISANLAGILGWNSGYGETYTTEQGDVINATAGTALSQFGITGNVTIVTNTGNITLANTAVISTTGEAADDSSIVKALAAHGITASFNESTHQFTIEGNSDNYIISMDPILQSVLGINTGNGTTYNVNVSYGDSTTTTITQTQTVYHTYRNTATAATTFGELGFADEETGSITLSDGSTVNVTADSTIQSIQNALNGKVSMNISNQGVVTLGGNSDTVYVSAMTSNVANALRVDTGFGETYTTNVNSTSATTATTLATLGMTSNGVIHTTNGDITINATDNIAAIQSALTAKGITSSLTNGQFSLGGASDTGVVTGMSANLSAALGNISTGLNFSYTTAAVEGTTEVTVSASDTLERLGINSNSSIVITGDNGGTINLTKDTTVQQLMDAFNSHGYTASLNSGVLSLRANGNNFIASDSNDVLSHFNISGNTYSETDKTLGQTKITDLRDSSGNALNISAGKVKVVQNGIEKTLTIETTDTLDTLNSKLANYGISMNYGLGHDGSISFTTTGDTYLSTYTGSGASDFLAKIGANNTWDTNKTINSQTLEYITNPDNVISTATKVTELRDASGNSLGITAGTYQVVSNGVTVNKTITNDTTVADMFADLSLYGISASIDSSGKISLGAASNTYLKYDGNSGESNVVNVLFNDWTMGNVYTSNHLDVEKTPTVTANRETKLSEIAGGNYQAGTLTVSDQVAGTTATITLGANETVGSFMDTLTLHGFNSYLNSSGQLVIQNNGDKTILTPAVGGSNAMSVLGLDTSNWEQPGHYAGSVTSDTVEHGIDVAADRDTLLSTLGITAGKFYVFSNGVRHEVDMSSDETIGSLFETLNSYGLHTTLKKDGNYSTIIIQGTGDSYIAKSNSVGASNIADVLNIQTAKQYNYNGDLQTTEYVTHTIVASNETFLSDYDKTVNDSVQHSEGTFAFEVDGEYNELHITSFETFGSLLEKFNRVGVKATLNDGTLRLETGNRSFNVITDATDSHLLSNLGLEYSEDLGGFCASSESLTQTITTLEDRNLSVANYADMNTQLSLLNISTGNLAIYRDGKKASIEVNANETLGQLRSRISSAFSDVDIKVEDGHLTFFSTDDAVVQVGSSVDTTNFSAICGFVENEDGTVTSAKELYKINAMSRVMDAGLFRKSNELGDVTAGTFNIGDDTFTIDENTTIASIISQINSSEKSNASAYWDSVDGKMVITARTTGSSLVNIEAGTSNFTDLLGLTNTDRNDDGSVQVTRLARDAQAVGKNSNFTINGTRFSSTSNIITSDISRINGITFNLKAASDETITITVDKDKEAATTAMQEFVDAYNELVTAVDEEVSKEGALSDQFTLKSIRNQIRSLVTSTFAGNSAFRNLSAIGISTVTASSGNISTTGIDTLFLDTEKFLEQYAKDPDSVKKLLVGDDTTNGILMQVENVVENALTSVSGYFSSADNSFAKTIQNLNDKISRANKSVEAYRARLENKFQSMDMLISKMQNQYDSFLGQQ